MYWPAHAHSHHSAGDALCSVDQLIARVTDLNYPALAVTDHRNMASAADLYVKARKAGIVGIPGYEANIALDRTIPTDKHLQLPLLAVTGTGYRNLVTLNNRAIDNYFNDRAYLDLADLAAAAEAGLTDGIVALTGSWNGLLPVVLREGHPLAVRNMLTALASWFPTGCYVELYATGHARDEAHNHLLHTLAADLGLPVVITADEHYATEDQAGIHAHLMRLSNRKTPEDHVTGAHHIPTPAELVDRYTVAQFSDGLAGLTDILERADVVIPELDTFTLQVPGMNNDPDTRLRVMCEDALVDLVDTGAIPTRKAPTYRKRLADELDVVTESGSAGLLLLGGELADYMKAENIMYAVRGSASGSLICWLRGITRLDPIKWDLPFERFLSRDRAKLPDIDFDIEHRRREEVIDWAARTYYVAPIGTWIRLGLDPKARDRDGVVKGTLANWMRDKLLADGDAHGKTRAFTTAEVGILDSLNAYALYAATGMHPGGLVVAPNRAAFAAVPMMAGKELDSDTPKPRGKGRARAAVAEKRLHVTAFDKDTVEAMGYVKYDLLGLNTLTALRTALELTGLSIDDIPYTDKATYQLISAGKVSSLFQIGGSTARPICRKVKPTKLADVIAIVALARPTTIDSGATKTYIARRKKEQPLIPRHPIIWAEVADTYGVLVYQEQGLNIMKALGLSVEDIERVRKAIKASNAGTSGAARTLQDLENHVLGLARDAGFTDDDVTWLRDGMRAYAGYSFNKAHATWYGILAYATAYLRANHPQQWWAAALDAWNDKNDKKGVWKDGYRVEMKVIDLFIKEARDDGVRILPPHINHSARSWRIDGPGIRAGLEYIPGIGGAVSPEIADNAPYASLQDFLLRTNPEIVTGSQNLALGRPPASCGGVITALHKAGALDGFDPITPPEKKPRRGRQTETLL